MPKLKTHRGAAKRFKRTASGRYKCRSANRNHILTKKATKRKRHLRNSTMVGPANTPAVQRMLCDI